MPRPSTPPGRVILCGAVHEAAPTLDALLASELADVVAVVTASEQGLRGLAGPVDLATPARAAGAAVIRTDDVNDPDIVAQLSALQPDLLVVVGWTRLIGAELLAVPRRGCVGFHASLLPRHRGRAPVNWSILRGETVTGNTMMLLDPGADTGDIVDQRSTAVTAEDTCATVYVRVAELGVQMLRDHLPALLAGTAPRRRQDPAQGDILPKRTPAMGVIDWARPPRDVHNWVRALTAPYPGAFGDWNGRQVMIWRTRVPEPHAHCGNDPGLVLDVDDAGMQVATAGGLVTVTSMSWAEQTPTAAPAWCAANGLGPGARFGLPAPELARWARGEGPRPQPQGVHDASGPRESAGRLRADTQRSGT